MESINLDTLDFIDNGATTVYADVVSNVELIAGNAVFTCCYLKRTPGGVLYKDASFYARIPKVWVPPGIALTCDRLGLTEVLPIAGKALASWVKVHTPWLH